MTFVSSYEQDATVLTKAKYELASTTPDFRKLYDNIKQYFLSQVQSGALPHKPYKPFSLFSHLLQQMQVAVFFGMPSFHDMM